MALVLRSLKIKSQWICGRVVLRLVIFWYSYSLSELKSDNEEYNNFRHVKLKIISKCKQYCSSQDSILLFPTNFSILYEKRKENVNIKYIKEVREIMHNWKSYICNISATGDQILKILVSIIIKRLLRDVHTRIL